MDPSAQCSPRVAFFGGSFDPPHRGHLAVARAARAAFRLDSVLFAPVGAQPLKPCSPGAAFADRLEMTRLAIDGEPGFSLSLVDAPRPDHEPNYTLETLLSLRAALPAGGLLFCLMGADSYLGLRGWRRAAEIPFAAPLIVASRPGREDGWPRDRVAAGLEDGSGCGCRADRGRGRSAQVCNRESRRRTRTVLPAARAARGDQRFGNQRPESGTRRRISRSRERPGIRCPTRWPLTFARGGCTVGAAEQMAKLGRRCGKKIRWKLESQPNA